MKVMFATPTYDGKFCEDFQLSMEATLDACRAAGVDAAISVIAKDCYVSRARNKLVANFLNSDADALFFLDADVGWPAEAVLRLLHRAEDFVCGIYPKKSDEEDYPVVVHCTLEGYPIVHDGLISLAGAPTGFMRLSRRCLEAMWKSYRHGLAYQDDGQQVLDLFKHGVENGRWWGEDYAFCNRWAAIGGTMWAEPNIDFTHTGTDAHGKAKVWSGNYHKFLMNCPRA